LTLLLEKYGFDYRYECHADYGHHQNQRIGHDFDPEKPS
jgi:hypothetical protein